MVDKETHFSSFFMVLLSATSLIVILANFFSGNFSNHSYAKTVKAPVYTEEEYYEPSFDMETQDEYQMEEPVEEFPEDTSETPTLELNTELEVNY